MAAIVMAAVNSKGGVGKSTLVLNIQSVIADMTDEKNNDLNLSVLVVDGDDQQTSTKTLVERSRLAEQALLQGLNVKGCPKLIKPVEHIFKDVDIEAYVKIVMNRHDFIIIDTKGADSDSSREVITFADILIVPLSPYGFDKQSLVDTLTQVKKAKSYNKKMLVMIVFNKVDKSATAKNREGRADVALTVESVFNKNGKTASDYGVFICDTELSYKPRFYSEMTKGLTVFEAAKGKSYDPKNEYDKLMNEIQVRYAQLNTNDEVAA